MSPHIFLLDLDSPEGCCPISFSPPPRGEMVVPLLLFFWPRDGLHGLPLSLLFSECMAVVIFWDACFRFSLFFSSFLHLGAFSKGSDLVSNTVSSLLPSFPKVKRNALFAQELFAPAFSFFLPFFCTQAMLFTLPFFLFSLHCFSQIS